MKVLENLRESNKQWRFISVGGSHGFGPPPKWSLEWMLLSDHITNKTTKSRLLAHGGTLCKRLNSTYKLQIRILLLALNVDKITTQDVGNVRPFSNVLPLPLRTTNKLDLSSIFIKTT